LLPERDYHGKPSGLPLSSEAAPAANGAWVKEQVAMEILWIVSYVLLWAAVLFLGFLLLGALRSLGLLRWRLEQLEATTPRRIGRGGLKPGTKAPAFSLSGSDTSEVALQDFLGRRLLLVFVQHGCKPCRNIVPELNRVQQQARLQVLAITNGDPEKARRWTEEVGANFPVLTQESWSVSRRYEVFATPFAFLIDEQGVVRAKGLVSRPAYIQYLLSDAVQKTQTEQSEAELSGVETGQG
jgi:methylamine dehydrogenase accessory protein MauD